MGLRHRDVEVRLGRHGVTGGGCTAVADENVFADPQAAHNLRSAAKAGRVAA